MATRVKPVPLRLNPDIEFEAALREQYDARPRPRRQEFLRQILSLGWDAWKQGRTPNAAARTPRATAPVAAPVAAPVSEPVAPARAPAAAPAAGLIGESSKALKGFFGEAQQ